MVVGWYHSHPGFGCWLSGVDVNTQQSFEALNARAVAVVIDPIQSVKGKVVIDAFRCISPQTMMLGQEPRQTTSNVGHLHKPSIQARWCTTGGVGTGEWGAERGRASGAGGSKVSGCRSCLPGAARPHSHTPIHTHTSRCAPRL